MRKGFVHIKEYDLTKMLIDYLDIDLEEDYQLVYLIEPLMYKDKPFILPEYEKFIEYHNKGTVIRPFINQAHAQYLINMFSDINSCDVKFEYVDSEKYETAYDGTLFIQKEKSNDTRKVTFEGINNVSVLMTSLLCKSLFSNGKFKKHIKDIVKIDNKIGEKK